MKARDISSLLCKLLGVYLIYTAVIDLPFLVSLPFVINNLPNDYRSAVGLGIATIILPFFAGLLLLDSSNKIARSMFPSDENDVVTSISPAKLMAIGVTVIGSLNIIDSFYHFTYAAAYFWKHPTISNDLPNASSVIGDAFKGGHFFGLYNGELIMGIAGLLLGVGLIYWSSNLARFILNQKSAEIE